MKSILKTVCIKENELGECVDVIELKTLTQEQITAYKQKAISHKAKEKALAKEESENLALEKANQKEKDYFRSVVIAKLQFDSLVDKGETETSDEFEEMYARFILGEDFEESKAPKDYLTILGRIK